MNTNNNFTYQGLLNRNVGNSATCDNMNATTITVTNLTVTHLLGILCQVSNTAIGNPEMTFSFDPITNTFTIYLNNSSIPLSRLSTNIYASNATPSTLVFRDATNSSTMNNLTISNLFNATSGSFADTLVCSNGNYLTDYPSIHLGNTAHAGIIRVHGDDNTGFSFIEGSSNGNMDIFTATVGSTLTLQPFKASNHVVCASDFTCNMGINLVAGQTYKIDGSAITTDDIPAGSNKYLNSLTTSNTTEITHNYSLYNLSSSLNTSSISNSKLLNSSISINGLGMSLGGIYTIPLLSITNGMLAGSIDNTKLSNSSISINGLGMSLGGTYTLPLLSITNGMLTGSIDNTKLLNSSISINGLGMSLGGTYTLPSITLGTTAMNLGSTYSSISGDLTFRDNINMLQPSAQTLTIGSNTSSGGLIIKCSSVNQSTIRHQVGVLNIDTESSGSLDLNMLVAGTILNVGCYSYFNRSAVFKTGGSNIINLNSIPDISATFGNNLIDGCITLSSTLSGKNTYIQSNLGNLYIDTNDVTKYLNLGMITGNTTKVNNLISNQNVSSGISMTTGYINLNNSTSSITTASVGTFTTTSYINGTSSGVNFGNLDGVMTLSSNQATSNGVPFATIIQNHGGSTYIDNQTSAIGAVPFIPYINIGSVTPNQIINLGNTTSDITYNNGNFLKYTKIRFTSFNVLAFSAVSTIWYPIRDTTVPANNLVLSYTGRLNEQIEINVRISGSGTGAGNLYMYYDIHIGTQPAYAITSTNPSIVTLTTPTVNQWGSWLFGGISNQYQGIYFTSYYTFTSAGTKTFYPVFRTQTTNSTWSIGSATAGINTLGEMNIKTLF